MTVQKTLVIDEDYNVRHRTVQVENLLVVEALTSTYQYCITCSVQCMFPIQSICSSESLLLQIWLQDFKSSSQIVKIKQLTTTSEKFK